MSDEADEGRTGSLPGVAAVLDIYGRLSAYTNVMVNVQPSQTRNATGGNVGSGLVVLESHS